ANDVYGFDICSPTMLTCVALLEYDLGMIASLPMHERANRVVLLCDYDLLDHNSQYPLLDLNGTARVMP
ncbi:hypothetical protein, partial [Paraburkholderia sp. SIMBA_054]|uniref:hypothetical protein n=1 Tax=Paraburkholderia sp. SIMBA_054 TaxID=3085795 RepID=UPI00397AD2C0